MTKPVIVQRTVKGEALTYAEHDANFTNLRDATISLTAGTGGTQVVSDLNGVITLVAGTGISLAGNNTAKTITITSSAGANNFGNVAVSGQTTIVADATSDTLTVAATAGGNIVLTTNASTDTLSIGVSTTPTFTSVGASTADILTIDTNKIEDRTTTERYIEFNNAGKLWVSNRSATNSNVRIESYYGDIELFLLASGKKVAITGDLQVTGDIDSQSSTQAFKVNSGATGTPANTSTVTGYLKILVGGTMRYFPYYT